ncbi:immunoglobulin lambda-1 light chain-like [Pseudophryne corroboree]|uniref:immunoglobulin lambda-1 light chain-like n=1 Tax=Pseudophryne corroboree TaxID=495146 RepID=UPI0030813A94
MAFSGVTGLLLCLLYSCSTQSRAHQYKHVSAHEGSTATLGCFVEGEEIQDLSVQWFKQLPDNAPTFILRHGGDSSLHWADPSLERFHSVKDVTNAQFLEIKNVSAEDSALYWCLRTKQPFHYVWGDGIYLSVHGGENVQAPSVTLMSSAESLGSSNLLHIACLVTGFYPPVIEVTWKVDKQTAAGDIIAGPTQSEEGDSYSMISILDLSSHPWRNISSFSCEVRHDSSRINITKDFSDCRRRT